MGAKELSQYIHIRIKELGISKTKVIERAHISRNGFYKILDERTTDEIKLSTFISLAVALNVHPLVLIRYYFSGWVRPIRIRSLQNTKYPNDYSGFVRDVTIPDNSVVTINQSFEKIWEIQNLGSIAWENRRLVCQDEDLIVTKKSGETAVPLSSTLANLIPLEKEIPIPTTPPNATVQLAVQFRAPDCPCTTISYWKMVDEFGGICFPEMRGVACQVRVVAI